MDGASGQLLQFAQKLPAYPCDLVPRTLQPELGHPWSHLLDSVIGKRAYRDDANRPNLWDAPPRPSYRLTCPVRHDKVGKTILKAW